MLTYAALFLFGSLMLTMCNSALLQLGRFKSKEFMRAPGGPLFFFHPILKKVLRHNEWENIYFYTSISRHIYELAFASFAMLALAKIQDAFILIGLSIVLHFIARLTAHLWSKTVLKITAPFASLYLLALFPVALPMVALMRLLTHKIHLTEDVELADSSKLREMISESELQSHLDAQDQKLISSFVNFKARIAKEIMVPRVDMFSLAADTPIKEAARLLSQENFSRIPLYNESLDQIIGVVLYKDFLKYYTNPDANFEAEIQTLSKPVLYAPESKKIAQLLQEFRLKQIHMAIIVDEYGGTEGIVTIEDILEELVGEIEDESDTEQDFWEISGTGWVVDAKMTLHDIENKLGIQIPESPDYETLGGYVFHCAGTIPASGWRLSHDAFDLEVLSSNERSLQKIKIIPRK